MTSPLNELYREIVLTRGQVTIVDAHNYEWLNSFKWFAHWSPRVKAFYAVRSPLRIKGQKRRGLIQMHRMILGLPYNDPRQGDHIDPSKTLLNIESNLRIATSSQQKMNQRLRCDNASGYKGVYLNKGFGKWYWQITVNGKCTTGCYFDSAKLAHEDRCQNLPNFHGEFARTA